MSRYTRRRFIAAGIGVTTIGSLAGCISNDDSSSDSEGDEPKSLSSFFVFGDFASQVAGDTATAETLVPIGQHGHGWEPGPQVQGTVFESDLFLYGMEGFQPWTDDLVTSLRDDDADVEIVAAGSGIDLLEDGHNHDHGHEDHDDEHDHEGEHEEGNEDEGEYDHGGEAPWEWAGLYHLEAGLHTYTFHEGPDPKMQLAVLETEEGGDHGIHHVEETAKHLYGNHDTHTPVEDGGTLTPSSESLYHLQFADSVETVFTLDIVSEGHYVLFGQHVPAEFDATLANDSGSAVEPEVTESAGGHDHEGEGDHDGEHDHESGAEHKDDREGNHEGEDGHGHDHSGGADPHFWLDPKRAKHAVDNIQSGFVDVDEDNADAYAENAEAYRKRLDELDESFQSTLENASKDVVFVAGHNAFQYLGQRYGFKVQTLTGLSPDDQPTPKDIERAQEIIAEHDLEYVCADPLESQQAANQLVEETDATEILPLTAIPGQTQEWVDEDWGYVDIMENINLETLKQALDAE
ncbi:zinc ABC transporter solute-binding protein [Natronococcus sp. JC468]|uniref:metal ABC transporter solute-binding protein, Zn/Mn family n=1 Tax=Natronococcus sp. JC468 TaxID=1961921 RepID=UPI00143B794A|nr:zinc ABC transporter substrate-binding protein [Natronococcus sp. JC468]NKE37358.1 zinc ABC transporter solute-binding protein [Natronococcus sp. JC468]